MDRNSAAEKLSDTAIARRERKPVSLRAYILREGGASSEGLVLDLSYEGCGIETPLALEPEEKVKLTVLGRGAIDAKVRWSSGGRAGLVFESDEAPRQEWPRVSHRVSMAADVSLRRLGQANFRVTVTDISPEGCRVELVDRPRVEEHVLIKFEGLEVLEAEVCWVEGYAAGLRFEKPIHPAVFELLLDRLR
ncbi:MAG TPA: PilZ domain-containing protein [Sphingomicrobium sp.]|nr:PilZ domain-containing protein [Sphingomicrobium sp.]